MLGPAPVPARPLPGVAGLVGSGVGDQARGEAGGRHQQEAGGHWGDSGHRHADNPVLRADYVISKMYFNCEASKNIFNNLSQLKVAFSV